ncbi:MAG: cupin domain-containing protein [Candidatus Riflebacteria bacterium]|nr:cupin domain-containing protein [Candidatus Riflebacteria bacterium]
MLSYKNLQEIIKHNVRGGTGEIRCRDYLTVSDDLPAFSSFGLNEMQPGATIPEHCHTDDAELYYIISGRGTGFHNGKSFPVNPGDAWLCKQGETHGILNNVVSEQVLSFINVFFKHRIS